MLIVIKLKGIILSVVMHHFENHKQMLEYRNFFYLETSGAYVMAVIYECS